MFKFVNICISLGMVIYRCVIETTFADSGGQIIYCRIQRRKEAYFEEDYKSILWNRPCFFDDLLIYTKKKKTERISCSRGITHFQFHNERWFLVTTVK